jgi:hypothetical protein
MDNPFVLASEDYTRDIGILNHYLKQGSLYLHKMTGRPLEDCQNHIKNLLSPTGERPFKDPNVMYLERQENGDREVKEGTLWGYIRGAINNGDLIAPTLTTYLNCTVKQSLLSLYIDDGVAARKKAKKEMFAAKMAKNKELEDIKNHEQNNKKLGNNAISGGHVTPSTPLYNKTAHNTLTSNCRSTSGYGNANNEKFLCGNRHYWSPEIVTNNITSIITQTDLVELERVMIKYGIRAPSVKETVDCIKYSAKLYWRNRVAMQKIENYIGKLNDIERSAFVYVGDMYFLRVFNPEFVRTFLDKLTAKGTGTFEKPSEVIKSRHEDYKILAVQICCEETKGKEEKEIVGTETEQLIAATVENAWGTISGYSDFIRAFWVTDNVPASVGWFPRSVRRCAVTSDTDSTIFTVQDWVEWHRGQIGFDQPCMATAATMIWLASQTITHILAKMSANFGVEKKRLHQIAMKNEFKFDAFVTTQVAKHYFALISCQEGNVFGKFKEEIKGVHLKSSNAPVEIIKDAKKMMSNIMMSIINGEKIKIKAILKHICETERAMIADIEKGSTTFLRRAQIKPAEAYTKGETESNYAHYTLWNDVFGPKYGFVDPPPYTCRKVTTIVNSSAKTREWIANMEDRDLAKRFTEWIERNKKNYIGTLYVPDQIVSSKGMPKEILEAAGIRKLVHDTCSVFYIILESLGVYMDNKKLTRLVSDYDYMFED